MTKSFPDILGQVLLSDWTPTYLMTIRQQQIKRGMQYRPKKKRNAVRSIQTQNLLSIHIKKTNLKKLEYIYIYIY